MGKALGGGSGWVLLTRSPRDGRLVNHWAADHAHSLAGGTPILALDMYEHAYHIDFGGQRRRPMSMPSWPTSTGSASPRASPASRRPSQAAHGRHADGAPRMLEAIRRSAGARRPPGRRRRRCRCACAARGARRPSRSTRSRRAAQGAKAARLLRLGLPGRRRLRRRAARARHRRRRLAGGIAAWRADGLPTEPLKEGEPP